MNKRVTLKQAAKALGPPFTESELRRGVNTGKYPAMRAGGPRGKIIFDMELLENRIRELMEENLKDDTLESRSVIRIAK
ncbi:MAG: hypothetical protein RBT15_03505 [Gudongella sp.]|jgi:hypothetical protein|nr:hypothetical protein [Gudongella sp.]